MSYRFCSLAADFGQSMSEVIFYQMLFCSVEFASYMLAIDKSQGMVPSNLTAAVGLTTVLLPTFPFCNIAENTATRLQGVADAFYGCPWYIFACKTTDIIFVAHSAGAEGVSFERSRHRLLFVGYFLEGINGVCDWLHEFRSTSHNCILCFSYADHLDSLLVSFAPSQLLMNRWWRRPLDVQR